MAFSNVKSYRRGTGIVRAYRRGSALAANKRLAFTGAAAFTDAYGKSKRTKRGRQLWKRETSLSARLNQAKATLRAKRSKGRSRSVYHGGRRY